MTQWDQFQFEDRIRQILRETTYDRPDHHFGRPFLTPYQIAIEFAHLYPDDVRSIGLPIGGKGTGQHNSLSQYIAGILSRKIQAGDLDDIEGGFISNSHLLEIAFDHNGERIESSLTESQYDLSIFRLSNS
ncbi:MAG: hypothetical protein IH873_01435 [Chloroflexi bacterium]|nr:hypothetical protein [Chloroflexota bacterium]